MRCTNGVLMENWYVKWSLGRIISFLHVEEKKKKNASIFCSSQKTTDEVCDISVNVVIQVFKIFTRL